MMTMAPLLASCDQPSGTGGRLVSASISLELEAPPPEWTNAHGWQVQLEQATLHVQSLWLYEQSPPLVAERWSLIPSAHAHPGHAHFDGGRALAELRQPLTLRWPEAPVRSIQVEAIEGVARAWSLHLGQPQGLIAQVRGVASRQGQRVPFEGLLELASGRRYEEVSGLPLELTLTEGGQARLVVHTLAWFEQARFEEADAMAPDSQPHVAWWLALRSSAAFSGSAHHALPAPR